MGNRFRLDAARAALLVVDIQDRLAPAMRQDDLARVLNRTAAAIAGAHALKLPVVVTEQYSKGLGHTVPQLREALGAFTPVEKLHFSCALDEVIAQFHGREQILIVGMETHVCVFQSVRDLAERGLQPYLLADAVTSRTAEDRRIGLDLCKEVGAVITTVESALFDLLVKAGSPEFKAISKAVR